MTDAAFEAAMRGIGPLDARGLMPLAEARAVLRGTTAFVKGEGDLVDSTHVLASDLLWAALLSLDDAAELCAVASRLDWQFQPRGMDNIDLWRRYGDGIVPWLATRLDGDTLVDTPWCVVPCLFACGSAEAFALAWRVERVAGMARPPVRATWLDLHPEVGAACLAALADPRARAQLAAMRARGVLASGPVAPTEPAILALLDACALGMVAPELNLWPSANGTGARRCHGLRAVAARDGDDWGLALERLEGERPGGVYPARLAVHAFGSRVGARYRGAAIATRALDARGAPSGRDDFVAWIRARGADAWGPAELALPALGLPGGRVVAAIPSLAHVEPGARPSESSVFRAIARAIATG